MTTSPPNGSSARTERYTVWRLCCALVLSAVGCVGDGGGPQPLDATGDAASATTADAGTGAPDGGYNGSTPDASGARDASGSAMDGSASSTADGAAPANAADAGGVRDGSVAGSTDTALIALGSGAIEAFVNGQSVGKSSGGTLLSAMPKLVDGTNVIALRAVGGSAAAYALAEVRGPFGRLLSSEAWRVKAAQGSETSSATPEFATVDFDDSSWSTAKMVATKVGPPFPEDSAALPVWSSASTDTLLLRLRVYLPAGLRADQPVGFGRGVTGGQGGSVVRVKDITELARELCRTRSGNKCTDDAARTIEVPSQVFDFTGTEGQASETGCNVKDCTGGVESERILNRQNWCDGKAQFSVQYDVAGTTPLLVGSNKTLLGIGPAATLKGKGLTLRNGVHNIIIRNLTITSLNPQVVWGGDALTIDDADGVWIDHNRFSLIGRQMVVTGFGKASNVTLSFNEFDGRSPYSATCNGAHYWALLFLGANDTLTLYGNWLHDISGRAPHAGGLMNATNTIQLVNNYLQHFPGHALEAYTNTARLLLEGNFFERVDQPMQTESDPGHVFGPVSSESACQSAIGRPCGINVLEPAPAANGKLALDQATLNAFGGSVVQGLVLPYAAREVPRSVPYLAGPHL